jgi:hypothetical protein
MIIKESARQKILLGDGYNYLFDRVNGNFLRWGDENNDPDYSPYGPEIADIEISTKCHGVGTVCNFCYKSNTPKGEDMSLETFQKLFDKLPRTLTQIAFGIGDIDSPNIWPIFDYTRSKGVVPNVTVNGAGITDEIAKRLSDTMGAVAVSLYDEDITYNAIQEITAAGLRQVNIHFMIAEETFSKAMKLLDDIKTDHRLKNLRAVVFLSLKQKGRAKSGYTRLSEEKFKQIVDKAFALEINIGFDSCGAFKFLDCVKDRPDYETLKRCSESCEAACFSSYFNVRGEYFPCSFIEGTPGWEKGLEIKDDFFKDVWCHEKTAHFRCKVMNCRHDKKACPVYDI